VKNSFRLENRLKSSVKSSECRALLVLPLFIYLCHFLSKFRVFFYLYLLICLSACLSTYLSLTLSNLPFLYLSVSLSIYFYLYSSFYLYVSLYNFLPFSFFASFYWNSISPSICLYTFRDSFNLSLSSYLSPSICLSLFPSVSIYISLFVSWFLSLSLTWSALFYEIRTKTVDSLILPNTTVNNFLPSTHTHAHTHTRTHAHMHTWFLLSPSHCTCSSLYLTICPPVSALYLTFSIAFYLSLQFVLSLFLSLSHTRTHTVPKRPICVISVSCPFLLHWGNWSRNDWASHQMQYTWRKIIPPSCQWFSANDDEKDYKKCFSFSSSKNIFNWHSIIKYNCSK